MLCGERDLGFDPTPRESLPFLHAVQLFTM